MRQLNDVVTSHIFPQGVLATFTEVANDGRAEPAMQGVRQASSLPVSVTTMSVAGFSFLPSVSFFPPGAFGSKGREVLEASGAHALTKVQCFHLGGTCGSAQRKYMVASFTVAIPDLVLGCGKE